MNPVKIREYKKYAQSSTRSANAPEVIVAAVAAKTKLKKNSPSRFQTWNFKMSEFWFEILGLRFETSP